ncbi:MAG TPA: YihY/virulence factor BrkB family protein [Bryobacteraceae bacterium]|jgi:membrane protein|nr:YihY/virulence factor BrkB family protein [Bryobacteraceae bacterium]
MSFWRSLPLILKATAASWDNHNAPRLGASLAYYTLLSLAPLSILIVAICSVVLSENTAEHEVLARVREVAGASSANTIKMLLSNAHQHNGVVATTIAFATLLFGASGVFVELRDSLNTIWDAPVPQSSGWRSVVHQRLLSFAMVLALCVLLLTSLLVSAGLALAEKLFSSAVPLHFSLLGEVANVLFTLIAFAVLFGLIFKFVPNVPIRWKEVTVGALATAILFAIGKALLAWYFSTAAVGSTYGAAGSLVALVAWVYYSAQIFFFGAVFTRVYADRFGSATAKRERKQARHQKP